MDQRLLRGAPAALTVSAHYAHRRGWNVSITVRHELEEWQEADHSQYECLTTEEMIDVVEATVNRL